MTVITWSWIFLVFFAIVYPGYLLLKGTRWRLPWLLVASYVFYGWWEWRYIPLLLFSTVVDYWIGRALAGSSDARRRNRLVATS